MFIVFGVRINHKKEMVVALILVFMEIIEVLLVITDCRFASMHTFTARPTRKMREIANNYEQDIPVITAHFRNS